MEVALDIAKFIINHQCNNNQPITNLRLNLILFIIQRESYFKRGVAVFSDDFIVMPFGVSIPNVYYEFNMFGGCKLLLRFDVDIDEADKEFILNVLSDVESKHTWELLIEVINRKDFIEAKSRGIYSTIKLDT